MSSGINCTSVCKCVWSEMKWVRGEVWRQWRLGAPLSDVPLTPFFHRSSSILPAGVTRRSPTWTVTSTSLHRGTNKPLALTAYGRSNVWIILKPQKKKLSITINHLEIVFGPGNYHLSLIIVQLVWSDNCGHSLSRAVFLSVVLPPNPNAESRLSPPSRAHHLEQVNTRRSIHTQYLRVTWTPLASRLGRLETRCAACPSNCCRVPLWGAQLI